MTRTQSIRALLIASLVGANLLVAAVSVTALRQSRELYLQRADTLVTNISSAVDQNISSSVEKIDLALQAAVDELQEQLAGKSIDAAAMNRFFARYEQRMPEVEGFRVLSTEGLVVIGNGVKPGDRFSAADRDYFLHFKANADTTLRITKPVWGRVVKHHIVIFARRFNHPSGDFAGVVFATISSDYFTRQLSRFNL